MPTQPCTEVLICSLPRPPCMLAARPWVQGWCPHAWSSESLQKVRVKNIIETKICNLSFYNIILLYFLKDRSRKCTPLSCRTFLNYFTEALRICVTFLWILFTYHDIIYPSFLRSFVKRSAWNQGWIWKLTENALQSHCQPWFGTIVSWALKQIPEVAIQVGVQG